MTRCYVIRQLLDTSLDITSLPNVATEHVFGLLLEGVSLPCPQKFSVPELQLTARLDFGPPTQLTVSIANVSEEEADQRASRFAQLLYFRFLLRFGAKIRRSEAPRLTAKMVATDTSKSGTGIASKLPTLRVAMAGTVTSPLIQDELDKLVSDMQLRAITPEIATSAQLYAAIEMFAAAMESQNAVVRFLILYSALTLAALFRAHRGAQQQVDSLLLERNPAIAMSPSPSPQRRGLQETLYTKLRNDLVHAEERGWDPAAAIVAIENNVSNFQRDAALVFSNL